MSYPKVVIIGGGFGGINVVKALKRAKIDLLMIDKKNHHLFQPLLYQVASATLSPADIATPLREILRHQKNTTVMMGEVHIVNKAKKEIVLINGKTFNYDYLVIAAGSSHFYFGNEQWKPFAPGLKTIVDALYIREKILTSFEKAERSDSTEEAKKYLNFVIIGGGPTGVEMAGSIAEIAHKAMLKNFRRICPEKSKIYLIEGASRILPPFPESLSIRAKKDLEKMGVQVITGKIVTNITNEGIQIDNEFIATRNIIWAAGNQASPLLKTLDIPLDRQGRAMVEKDLSIPGHSEIFVIGDAACSIGKNGKPLPGIAPAAIQMAKYVGRIIKKNLPKDKRLPFKYFDKGSIATIGKASAVGYIRKIKLTGWFAWLAWGSIHIAYLVCYRSRFTVMLGWCFHYMTGVRGARIIHQSIDQDKNTT